MRQGVSVLRFIWAHVRRRPARAATLLLGILFAATGFTVLTGTTQAARLQVTGTVQSSTRAAYDILVRPLGTRTPLEDAAALVRPNYLSGIFGGITAAQSTQISGVPGVEVAAPIAMAGYTNVLIYSDLDLTGVVDPDADRQVVRIDRTFLADRGLSRTTGLPLYVYLTKHPVSWPIADGYSDDKAQFTGGEVRRGRDLCGGQLAVLEEGRPICPVLDPALRSALSTDRNRSDMVVARLLPDHRFQTGDGPGTRTSTSDRLVLTIATHVPMLLAAVDPAAEDKLVGLRAAMNGGRFLRPGEPAAAGALPVLAAGRAYTDDAVDTSLSRARLNAAPSGDNPDRLAARLDALPATPTGRIRSDAAQSYRNTLSRLLDSPGGLELEHLVQTGPTGYDRGPGGVLTARTVPPDPQAYQSASISGLTVPWQIDDTSFRTLAPIRRADGGDTEVLRLVGTFDPERVTGFSALSSVPLETYDTTGPIGGDQRSRNLLAGQALLPDGNPGGYLASPPLLLTTVDALTDMLKGTDARNANAPISAVRVRVADAGGYSATSRERVRVVAQEIATRTGLDVDITYGSSPTPQQVEMAAGRYGRPALLITEGWSKEGVATAIVSAVDRKSAILFILVLVVCALFLVNAVTAGIRDRRAELGVLVALGWPGRRIAAAVLGEIVLLGIVAGLLSLALTWPLHAALHVDIGRAQALLAVPVAVVLAVVAGVVPAARAARSHPADILRPAVAPPRRPRPAGSVTAMGLTNVVRTPGRTALGAGALAIGIAAMTVLVAVNLAFRGVIVGTLLGDAVSLSVRDVDAIAVTTTVLLGTLAVADTLYINVRERAAELAALRVMGWPPSALTRLVATEGFGIGLIGALTGGAAGLGAAAALTGTLPPELLLAAGLATATGTIAATVAALVPAMILDRTPVAQVLAEE